MIANKSYAYDLSSIPELEPYLPSKKDFKIIKNPNVNKKQNVNSKTISKAKTNPKLSLVVSVLLIFTMCIIMSIRYNIISEKNLELQRLKMKQTKVNSELATTEVMVDQLVDKNTVESYAKQQLGMQKPEKSQIVYINSDFETTVEQGNDNNIFEKVIYKLKNLIGIE